MNPIESTFAIQVFNLNNEALNQQLEKLVIDEMHEKGKIKKKQHSNIGGWQSEFDLHANLGDATPLNTTLLKLFDSFSSPLIQYINNCCIKANAMTSKSYKWNYREAWFNVSVPGSYNAPHTHPLSEISGAYYIRTEEPPKEYPFSGRIDFYLDEKSIHFFPKPGTLILFPSTILHFVHPYYGADNRINLSFNIDNVHSNVHSLES